MITLNSNIDAFSKKDAFYVIEKLMKSDDKTITDVETEMLYKYFLPKLSKKKAKSAIHWVAMACSSPKDIRRYLTYMYSDGDYLVATDGHRLHMVETDLDEGYYCPNSFERVDLDDKYPDFNRVIPSYKTVQEYDLTKCESREHFKTIHIKVKDTWLNRDFLMPGCNGSQIANLAVTDDTNSAVYGLSEYGQFVVMPTRA